MTAHAKLSASGSHRWINCPGSVALEQAFLEQHNIVEVSSPYAEEGTRAHELAEKALRADCEPIDLTDDSDVADYVSIYTDYVRNIKGDDGHLFVEQKVDFSPWVPEGFGTSDAIVFVGSHLHCADLKFGRGIAVNADMNSQGLLYALGAYSDFNIMFDIEQVTIHIVQPRIDNISTFTLSLTDLLEWGEWVKGKAAQALSANAPIVAGEKQCQFCKAKAQCPTLYKSTTEAIMSDFDSLDDVDLTPVNLLTDDQLRLAMQHKKLIVSWLDAVESEIERRMNDGKTFTGFKLVAGRSLRQWANERDAEFKLIELLGDNAYTKKLISVAQAEKALGKKHIGVITDLVIKPEGKPTLVPESDPRPPLGATADDFENLS